MQVQFASDSTAIGLTKPRLEELAVQTKLSKNMYTKLQVQNLRIDEVGDPEGARADPQGGHLCQFAGPMVQFLMPVFEGPAKVF